MLSQILKMPVTIFGPKQASKRQISDEKLQISDEKLQISDGQISDVPVTRSSSGKYSATFTSTSSFKEEVNPIRRLNLILLILLTSA